MNNVICYGKINAYPVEESLLNGIFPITLRQKANQVEKTKCNKTDTLIFIYNDSNIFLEKSTFLKIRNSYKNNSDKMINND